MFASKYMYYILDICNGLDLRTFEFKIINYPGIHS